MPDSKNQNGEKIEHELFDVGILLKGIHAVLEIVGGIFVFIINPDLVFRFANAVTARELAEDPLDLFARYFLDFSYNFSPGTKQFIAFYLLSHGIVNLVLVLGLFKKKMWAYKASFVALTVFALYQLYRYAHKPSIWLIILTVFDFVIIWLIWREYRRMKKSN